jgi:hypothetical protein
VFAARTAVIIVAMAAAAAAVIDVCRIHDLIKRINDTAKPGLLTARAKLALPELGLPSYCKTPYACPYPAVACART